MDKAISLPYFCLRKLAWTSVTNMPGSPCRIHGRKLVLGADAMNNPLLLPIMVVCTLQLPAIFLWDEKLVVPLVATPNVDKCKRRQKEKATELGYILRIIPMQNKYYSFYKQLGQSPNRNYAMSRKMGGWDGHGKRGKHFGSRLIHT